MPVLEFGLNPLPPGVRVAWGCRAIITQDGHFDVPPDRMGTIGPEEERKALINHLNTQASTKPWEKVKQLLRSGELSTRSDDKVTLYEDDTLVVEASPNASAGYLYVAAYYKADVARDVPVTVRWNPDEDPEVGWSRLHSKDPFSINGVRMHLEAWEVGMRDGIQVGLGPWAEDLEHLSLIYEAGGAFDTMELDGRYYVIVAFPHA